MRVQSPISALVFLIIVGTTISFAITTARADNASILMERDTVVYGEWVPPDKDAIIHIKPCSTTMPQDLCATLVRHAYENLSEKDVLNPDPVLRAKPLVGVSILEGLKANGHDKWKGGALYDPRTGKTYHAKVKLLGQDKLKITGCIGPGLCRGYVWDRAAPDIRLKAGNVVMPLGNQMPAEPIGLGS